MEKTSKFCYDYPRPALTSDCIILNKNDDVIKVLLIKRAYEPFKKHWAFPGGFVDSDETTLQAAKRELIEETGITVEELKQLQTFSDIGRDPRGKTVSVVYYAFVSSENISVKAGDDATEAEWFDINKLPELAFDHADIMDFAVKQLELKSCK